MYYILLPILLPVSYKSFYNNNIIIVFDVILYCSIKNTFSKLFNDYGANLSD